MGVSYWVKPVSRYLGLPFESFIKGGFGDDGRRILAAVHRRLARVVVPAALGEIRSESEQWRRPNHAGARDAIQMSPGGRRVVHGTTPLG